MYAFAYVAAAAIVVLGGALVVAPARVTRALHDWYIVPPRVEAAQRLRLAICRAVGLALCGGGVVFALSITTALRGTF